MESKITQTSNLIQLLKERDAIVSQLTTNMFDIIRPTVLDTLVELFGVTDSEADWLDIQYMDDILILMCIIHLNTDQTTNYLRKVFKNSAITDDVSPGMKMIRIGLPIDLVFGPKNDIIKYLYDVADESVVDKVISTTNTHESITPSFDTSRLTEEQIIQLELFDDDHTGIKH